MRHLDIKYKLVAIFCISALYGCDQRISTRVSDVTKSQVLTLTSSVAEPSGVSLRIRGEVDGVATVWLEGGEKVKIGKTVDIEIYQDCFDPKCDFYYTPSGVTKGRITIEYRFR